ncbi:hypothetical protein J6590_062088 [Homalodisca vitripennis]|nr:hypothetical protein J6590_062088 [Homalodisca vitripennis]
MGLVSTYFPVSNQQKVYTSCAVLAEGLSHQHVKYLIRFRDDLSSSSLASCLVIIDFSRFQYHDACQIKTFSVNS